MEKVLNYVYKKYKWYRGMIMKLFYQSYTPKLNKKLCDEPKIIVSLTSFPPRLGSLHITINSILNQKYKPDKVILYLGNDVTDEMISTSLKKCEQNGLEIKKGYEDIKPHKKYFFAMQEYPEDIIITVDDDVIYHRDLIEELLKAHMQYPNAVICRRARKVLYDGEGKLKSYSTWPEIKENDGPSFDILPTGMGGVLYPPHCLHKEAFNVEAIKKYCLKADDIWLKYMEIRNDTKAVFIKAKYGDPEIIPEVFSTGLYNENVDENKNDNYINIMEQQYLIDITGRTKSL